MPRLILLNGPPGIGKSTIAQRYADDHPGTLDLDLDLLRAGLDEWPQDPEAAGLAARALGIELARTHLTGGHDVVVPQLLARPAFIETLAQLADEIGAEFHELVLLDEREPAVARFVSRSAERAATGAPDDQGDQVALAGGTAALEDTYDRLVALIGRRPHARVVTAETDDIDGTYAAVLEQLDGGGRLSHPHA